jgi:anti-anti-sigma factor
MGGQLPQRQDLFRTQTAADGNTVRVELFGELDIVSMHGFQSTVTAILAEKPEHLIFDLTGTRFVSVQGFAAIGRCGREVGTTSVHSRGDLAERILRLLGYDEVICVSIDQAV